jgi:peptide/nickel transport system substrate-binding protein
MQGTTEPSMLSRTPTLSRRDVLARWGKAAGLALLASSGLATPVVAAPPPRVGLPAVLTSSASGDLDLRSRAAGSVAIVGPAFHSQANADQMLRMLVWQAPTILNPHLAQGTKDLFAARCCLEPLLTADSDGTLTPVLAAEVPSRANGGLPDNRTVVYRLRRDVVWADGRPFTADDVVFTFEFISDRATTATSLGTYVAVERVDAVDDLTVQITFKEPTAGWYVPFVGAPGMILPRHGLAGAIGPDARSAPFNLKPFGTGPYVVEDFKPGDLVVYRANPYYREVGKPFFGEIQLKGGGDATSAARAVFQTGEMDYAWNLLVESQVLEDIMLGGMGDLVSAPGAGVEHLLLNQSDPNLEIDGEKSHPSTRHPFLADPGVREAMALAVNRDAIAKQLYGPLGDATANVLTTPTSLSSQNARIAFDIGRANSILDGAGYGRGPDGIRVTPAGVKMSMQFVTTVSALRQKEQAIIKAGWQQLGIDAQLKSVDAGVFFSSDPSNPDTSSHFYADVQMLNFAFVSPFPVSYMRRFYAGDRARDWAQKANNWTGSNVMKWQDEQYDRLYEQVGTDADATRRQEIWTALNDIVVGSHAVIPLVNRKVAAGKSRRLVGPEPRAFDQETWNIADWRWAP